MANTTIKTRILLRNDTLANWTSSNLVLAKGEVAIATLDGGALAEVRVGNGTTWANSLKLNVNADQISGLVDAIKGTAKKYQVVANGEGGNSWKLQEAALSGGDWTDVSTFAVDFSAINSQITSLTSDVNNIKTDLAATKTTLNTVSSDYLKASVFGTLSNEIGLSAANASNQVVTKKDIADLAGAMHFRGAVSDPSEITKPVAGDIIIIPSTSKEYVYNGTEWVELGDEKLYATKAEVSAYALETEAAQMSAFAYSEASAYTDNAIKGLDVTASEAGNGEAGFVTVVTEEDGKVAVTKKTIELSDITDVANISANIGLSNYALSADVTTLVSETSSTLVGESADVSSKNTIYGAKKYADDKVNELSSGFLIFDCGNSKLRSGEPTAGDLTA